MRYMGILRGLYEGIMGVVWDTMGLYLRLYGDSMRLLGISWGLYENTMGII